MPYRIDLVDPPDDALDRLLELKALDVEAVAGGLAAIMPDSIDANSVASALGRDVRVTAAHDTRRATGDHSSGLAAETRRASDDRRARIRNRTACDDGALPRGAGT